MKIIDLKEFHSGKFIKQREYQSFSPEKIGKLYHAIKTAYGKATKKSGVAVWCKVPRFKTHGLSL